MYYVNEGHGLFTTHPLTRLTSAAAQYFCESNDLKDIGRMYTSSFGDF